MPLKIIKGAGAGSEEFNIPASDTNGHSARQWFRCIPLMVRQVEQILQSRAFPYRTRGDFLRHALHRHIQWLSQQDGPVVTTQGQSEIVMDILRQEEMENDMSVVFERLDRLVSKRISEGANGEARRLVLVVLKQIEDMPSGHWKSQYKKRMAKYTETLNVQRKANLGDIEEEEEE